MRYCDLTFATPEENLACDEALLDQCETGQTEDLLRFWEPTSYFVVVGYANAVQAEVNLLFCRQHNLPVLRRCSGGGTVLQGPGCMNYSLILRITEGSPLQGISSTNDFVLGRNAQALGTLLNAPVEKQGHTDLALRGLKFSGNAQRRRQHSLLFHGCFLLNLDLDLVQKTLPLPSKQPEYRASRSHQDFLLNLELPAAKLKEMLAAAWNATVPASDLPREELKRLAREKYARQEWNFKF